MATEQNDINLLSREQLYELVWQRPLSHLAPDFGLDGPGVARICRTRNIPCPPLGYWQKLAVGRAPVKVSLPPEVEGGHRPPTTKTGGRIRPAVTAVARQSQPASANGGLVERASGEKADGLDRLDRLHPAIAAWLQEHRRNQQERAAEIKRHAREAWGSAWSTIPDLTERDLQRFRASSALCHAVEKAGGKTISARMQPGILTFRIEGREIECKVVEKMTQSGAKPDEAWTAFSHVHRTGLRSTGYLRAAVTSWIPYSKVEWIETAQTSFGQLIPSIAAKLTSLAHELREWERKRAEEDARRRLEEQQRYERRRQQERDDARWESFMTLARDWHERTLLIKFMGEVERRIGTDDSAEIEGRTLVQWMEWARERINSLDPFTEGVAGLFANVGQAGSRY